MPTLRPFRALRYDPAVVGSLEDVISPPYDVISPAEQARLANRHPRNSVYLDFPPELPGDRPGDRHRRAAAALATWRSDGALVQDPVPSIYPYEATSSLSVGETRVQHGFFARLTLEPFGSASGVLPHERTLGGPRADRLALLRATGANLSPVVGLYDSPGGASAHLLAELTAGPPAEDVLDDAGVRHRVWPVAAGVRGDGGAVDRLMGLAEAAPIVIADGHHRYSTALEYRDQRLAERSDRADAARADPAWETIFILLFDIAATSMTILPTHRVVSGEPRGRPLYEALSAHFEIEELPSSTMLARSFDAGDPAGGQTRRPRIGCWSGGQAAILYPLPGAFEATLVSQASAATRSLTVSLLQAMLLAIYDLDAAAIDEGTRLVYVKGAAEAITAAGDEASAFLLDPVSPADVLRVARAGDLMPQKSTYFSPKPATGLLFAPGEW